MDKVKIIINGTEVYGWSNAVDAMMEANVSDMALTLERLLPASPLAVKELTKLALERFPMPRRTGMMPGSLTRIATLRTFNRRADKLLATSK